MQNDILTYDVLIIGAGPAGLASAIQLKQLAKLNNLDLSLAILEKGSTVGAHIISGAIFEADVLNELIPDWRDKNPPVFTKVTKDKFYFLTKNNKLSLPIPGSLHNTDKNNYIISLSNLCKWLANQAENMGIEIYPGFAASQALIKNNQVYGVKTNDLGLDKQGNKTDLYQPGVEIHAKQVILAEGSRGSITKQISNYFNLAQHSAPQTYGLGIKEIWQIDPKHHQLGLVEHTIGWPLDYKTYGGSFIYHLPDSKIAYGFVVGLDYKNPYFSPFEESQRFKLHPKLKPLFENGERLSYGARAITEGGYQSIPKLTFPGGLIIGDAAGFLNIAKIKGTHNAIRSGMIAAQSVVENFKINNILNTEITDYQDNINHSVINSELYKIRNIRPSFNFGLLPGLAYSAFDYYVLHGKTPWTLRHHQDHKTLIKNSQKINYPKPDNKITFDRLSSVFLANTHHNEHQPSHLKLLNPDLAVKINFTEYHGPEQYYCPAGVYEYLYNADNKPYLQINSQNCVHCKTCDIKDPLQNINWQTPEGGGGPNYTDM
ncbi:MAG: electron transfer flavoprotein-ubiquinone oxidoreductase [Gammaproteobacteria bacterium]|nr:electron transfer flavoprotein-ubiquinone oxidoreductase [Gammaproteobacteria bacterium]